MKKFVKVLFGTFVVILGAVTLAASIGAANVQNSRGGYSAVCDISADAKEWLLQEVSKGDTFLEFANNLVTFAVNNFTYKDIDYFLLQTADVDAFIFENNLTGVCFEFAVFAKAAALVWAEENSKPIKAYVCNTWWRDENKRRKGHSYNYFELDGEVYNLDLTADLNDKRAGRKRVGLTRIELPKEVANLMLFKPYRTTFI